MVAEEISSALTNLVCRETLSVMGSMIALMVVMKPIAVSRYTYEYLYLCKRKYLGPKRT